MPATIQEYVGKFGEHRRAHGAFAHTLEDRGTPPQQLSVAADCTFQQTDDGFKVSRVALTAEGKVPGITDEQFADAARAAEAFCPISNALRGNVEITLTPRLLQGVAQS